MAADFDNLLLNVGISFFAALAGAYAGTRAATRWQEKILEKTEQRLHRTSIFNAMLICRHFAMMTDKIEKQIKKNGKKLEWQEVNIIGITLTFGYEQNMQALLSALGPARKDLIEKVIHAEWVAKSVSEVCKERNEVCREAQRHMISRGSPRFMTKEQVVDLIGEAWAAKLDFLTRELHSAVEEAITQNRESHNELGSVLKEIDRKNSSFWIKNSDKLILFLLGAIIGAVSTYGTTLAIEMLKSMR